MIEVVAFLVFTSVVLVVDEHRERHRRLARVYRHARPR